MTTDISAETSDTSLDEAAAEAFAERVLGDYAGANAFFMAAIGDRLQLFGELAQHGPASSDELAERTGLQERYLREWLNGMAAAGYLSYDRASGRHAVPSEHVPVLAQEAGPMFFGSAFFDYSTNYGDSFHQLLAAFRQGGGVSQETYGEEVSHSIDRFTAPWFENQLLPVWLPLMPDIQATLQAGASVCDVGCGRGRALIKLAQAFPNCELTGVDIYEPSLRAAQESARQAGVADRVRFELRDAAGGLDGCYDLVTTFDVLHDSADPRGLLTSIRRALSEGGHYLCVDINCAERSEDNVGPMGTILYGLSLAYCLPVSLAGDGAGLGTLGLPEGRLRDLATQVGFSGVRRLPVDDPFNNVYELTA